MGFTPQDNDISLTADAQGLSIYQYSAGAEEVTTLDLSVSYPDGDPSTIQTRIRDRNGNHINLPEGAFYTSVPGHYDAKLLATDAQGNVLAHLNQTVKVVNRARRLLIPDGYVMIDCDKPVDKTNPTTPVIDVRNGELINLRLVHPEPSYNALGQARTSMGPNDQSECFLSPTPLYPVGKGETILDDADTPQHIAWRYTFTSDDYAAAGTFEVIGGANRRYIDVTITNVNIDWPAEALRDKAVISTVKGKIKVRVWEDYVPSRLPGLAPVTDALMADMLGSVFAVESYQLNVTAVLIGAVGTETLNRRHYWAQLQNPQDRSGTFLCSTRDDYAALTAGNASLAPDTITYPVGVVSSPNYQINLVTPVIGAETQKPNVPPTVKLEYGVYPTPKYNWMTLWLGRTNEKRFKLYVLPLTWTPADIPTVEGFATVLPIQFYIQDVQNIGAQTSCPEFVELSFFNRDERDAHAGFLDLAHEGAINPVVGYSETQSNALECGRVYTVWAYLPGYLLSPGGGYLSSLFVNGVKLCDINQKPITFDPNPVDEVWYGDYARWVAYGNFTHLYNSANPQDTALHRVSHLVRTMNEYAVTVDNAQSIAAPHTPRFLNDSTMSMVVAYMLANGNWAGCIDQWATKMQTFVAALNHDMSWLGGTNVFGDDSDYGLNLGLPFGVYTAYFSGAPSFQVDKNILSLLFAHFIWQPESQRIPLTLDWNGRVVAVGYEVFEGIDPSEWDYAAYGMAGIWMQSTLWECAKRYSYNIFKYWDVYWVGFAVNTRGNTGYRMDGNHSLQFLNDPTKFIGYDPGANPPAQVTSETWQSSGSFMANQRLALGATDITAGHLHVVSSNQVYTGDRSPIPSWQGPNAALNIVDFQAPFSHVDGGLDYKWVFPDDSVTTPDGDRPTTTNPTVAIP